MKPALTAEEWDSGYESKDLTVSLRSNNRLGVSAHSYPLGGTLGDPRDIHALAALCLHGQPFGFTREDVVRHRNVAESIRMSLELQGPAATWDFPREEIDSKARHAAWHDSMADRIEALLPPEEA